MFLFEFYGLRQVCENHREDKFLRAAKFKYYGNEQKVSSKNNAAGKKHRKMKALSFSVAISLALAIFIVPTTTLAPDVDAFEDSRAMAMSVGDIDEFSIVITDNCIVPATVPITQAATTEAATVADVTKAVKPTTAVKNTKTEKKHSENTSSAVSETSKKEIIEVTEDEYYFEDIENNQNSEVVSPGTDYDYSGDYLVSISNPDKSYSPKSVTLSSYDRAKLERLVMGEAGSMGYTGCALVAQSIRDAMNRSNTTSIDRIISEYQYYAPTDKEPNADVKSAVSYIFDQNGSAVQHRILCFYTGSSGWHETQNYIVSCGNVRFFDLWY